ncbi:MAG: hypothetical protein HY278_06865 [candidate division NC10 bacterium]|nr:hypothetical protein [candidate division NC10 bacterium]
MKDGGTGSKSRCWRLALLVFLLVYLPLDAFDADTSDTFDESVVQVRVQAGEDAIHSVLHPVVIVSEIPKAADGFHAVAHLSLPICTLPVTRKPFSLPRSDDPHVASPLPVKSTLLSLIV